MSIAIYNYQQEDMLSLKFAVNHFSDLPFDIYNAFAVLKQDNNY